jgi:hypothetical protein
MIHRHARRVAFAVSLAAAAIFGAPGFAQQQPATQPPSAEAAPAPSASHIAVAREVVELSGVSRSLEIIIPQVLNEAHLSFARQRPELAAQLDQASQQVLLQLVPQREQVLMLAANAFAREMSEADLQAVAAFFKTSAGRAYVEKQPRLLDELLVAIQPWTQQLNQTVVALFRQELQKLGIQL